MRIKAFSLLELIVSLVIISVSIAFLSGLFIKDEKYKTYNHLQKLENEFYNNKELTNTQKIKFN